MKKYTMCIGLNDQDTKRQEIQTVDAYKIVMNIFASTTGGATVYEGQGCYTHDDGTIVIEKSLIAFIFTDDDAAIRQAAEMVKAALNQESVAVEVAEVNSMFI